MAGVLGVGVWVFRVISVSAFPAFRYRGLKASRLQSLEFVSGLMKHVGGFARQSLQRHSGNSLTMVASFLWRHRKSSELYYHFCRAQLLSVSSRK